MEENLATELLHEVKAQSRRWFIAFIVVLLLWFVTIGIFFWYLSLPVEEYDVVQTTEGGERNIQTFVGGNNYGDTEGEVQETGN